MTTRTPSLLDCGEWSSCVPGIILTPLFRLSIPLPVRTTADQPFSRPSASMASGAAAGVV